MKAIVTADLSLIRTIGRGEYTLHPVIVFTREMIQNAWDAVRRSGREPKVSIEYTLENDHVWMSVSDNGDGMTEDVLVHQYLALGGSGKRQEYNVYGKPTGGFGIGTAAALSLAEFEVRTHDLSMSSDDIRNQKDVKTGCPYVDGTIVTGYCDERTENADIKTAIDYISLSDVRVHVLYKDAGKVRIDGDFGTKVTPILFKNMVESPDYDAAQKLGMDLQGRSTNRGSGWDICRVHGLVQFINNSYYRKSLDIMVSLNPSTIPGDSDYPMTSNRESLRGQYRSTFNRIIERANVDSVTTQRDLDNPRKRLPSQTIGLVAGHKLTAGKRKTSKAKNSAGDIVIYTEASTRKLSMTMNSQGQVTRSTATPMMVDGTFKEVIKQAVMSGSVSIGTQSSATRSAPGMVIASDSSTPPHEMDSFWAKLKDVPITVAKHDPKDDQLSIYLDRYVKNPSTAARDARLCHVISEIASWVVPEGYVFGVGLTHDENCDGKVVDENGVKYICVNPNKVDFGEQSPVKVLKLWHLVCHEVAHFWVNIHNEQFASIEAGNANDSAAFIYANLKDIAKLFKA